MNDDITNTQRSINQRGTSSAYRIQRLRKIDPGIASEVESGDVSANAAMVFLGLCPNQGSYRHTYRGICLLFSRLSKRDRDRFLREYL